MASGDRASVLLTVEQYRLCYERVVRSLRRMFETKNKNTRRRVGTHETIAARRETRAVFVEIILLVYSLSVIRGIGAAGHARFHGMEEA
jgi:argonaute-like protein implicated in RNA metabolism and viral defense